jgi:hypothetical protein
MEPRSSSNDDQARYQAQYWNGPEAGHWLVHEHRYQRVAVAALLARWTLGYAGLYYVVGLQVRRPEALTALVPLFVPISLLSTAYVPAELLPGWVRSAAAVNPYGHVVDTVCAAMTGPWMPASSPPGSPRSSQPSPSPAGRRPPLRRPHPPRLTNPGTGGTTMPRHHHTSSRGGRHRRAVLVTALLRRLVGRRRQHRWHRPHSGGQSRARGRWAQPSPRTWRHRRLRARWSR